jgi:hypothetical protein
VSEDIMDGPELLVLLISEIGVAAPVAWVDRMLM